MNLKELAVELQKKIDSKMQKFSKLGKDAKQLNKKLDAVKLEMTKIVEELTPIESLVRVQNPNMCDLFDALKEQYGK